MPKLHLHLGAHKTASTLLQEHVRQYKAYLKASHIAYHGPEDVRSKIKSSVADSKSFVLAERASELVTHANAARLVVISDENLIGGCRKAFSRDLLYPDLIDRLSSLQSVLPQAPNKIFFSIRSLESFIISAFCETLRHASSFVPFETYCGADISFDKLQWSSVLKRISAIFPATEIFVWRLEDLTTALPRALELMFDGMELQILSSLASAGPVRPSLSRKAVNLLARVSPPLQGNEYRRTVHAFEKLFPKGATYPGLYPKRLAQVDFQTSYSQDLKRIEAMDNVSFIT